jgi:hypothetical protein
MANQEMMLIGQKGGSLMCWLFASGGADGCLASSISL